MEELPAELTMKDARINSCNNHGIISFPELIGTIIPVPRFKKQIIKIELSSEIIEHFCIPYSSLKCPFIIKWTDQL